MANMAVTCITAVSIVIFPVLKRLNRDTADHLYKPLRDLITLPMFGVLLCYAPAKYLLTLWLPEYGDSIRYLAVLLPFCIFEVRNSVLTCTYLKVWLGQKYIMYANIITLAASVVITWLTVYVVGSIDLAARINYDIVRAENRPDRTCCKKNISRSGWDSSMSRNCCLQQYL